MRCRFRDDAKGKRRARDRAAAGRSRERRTTMDNDADGGKENKIERIDRADADLSKRQFRNYERGTGSVGRPAGRNEIVSRFSSLTARGVDRARGHNPTTIRISRWGRVVYISYMHSSLFRATLNTGRSSAKSTARRDASPSSSTKRCCTSMEREAHRVAEMLRRELIFLLSCSLNKCLLRFISSNRFYEKKLLF